MTQRKNETFANDTFSEAPKKKNVTNKTDVHLIDDAWSLDIIDLEDFGPGKTKTIVMFW